MLVLHKILGDSVDYKQSLFFFRFSHVPLPSRATSHARGHLRVSRCARRTTENRSLGDSKKVNTNEWASCLFCIYAQQHWWLTRNNVFLLEQKFTFEQPFRVLPANLGFYNWTSVEMTHQSGWNFTVTSGLSNNTWKTSDGLAGMNLSTKILTVTNLSSW